MSIPIRPDKVMLLNCELLPLILANSSRRWSSRFELARLVDMTNGSINTKWNVRFSPFFIIESGHPFDITAGRDLYGITLFSARPGIPTDLSKPGLILTKYGLLDPNPSSERIPSRNFGRGPGAVTVNMRVAKLIEFGPRGEGSPPPASGPGGGGGDGDRRGPPGVF